MYINQLYIVLCNCTLRIARFHKYYNFVLCLHLIASQHRIFTKSIIQAEILTLFQFSINVILRHYTIQYYITSSSLQRLHHWMVHCTVHSVQCTFYKYNLHCTICTIDIVQFVPTICIYSRFLDKLCVYSK